MFRFWVRLVCREDNILGGVFLYVDHGVSTICSRCCEKIHSFFDLFFHGSSAHCTILEDSMYQ